MSKWQRVATLSSLVFLAMLNTANAETVAIIDATVYANTSTGPVESATVLLEGGKIVAVGADVAPRADARIIDGRDLVVTPGFMNSSSHLGLTEVSSVDSTSDYSIDSGPLGAAFDIQYALNANSELVANARVDGLARAISIPESTSFSPFSGLGALLHLKAGHTILEKPRIGLFVEVGGQTSAQNGGSRSAQWVVLRRALVEAAGIRQNRRSSQARDSYFARQDLEVLREVIDGEIPLVIGADRESDIRQAIDVATEFGIRVIVRGGLEAWLVAEELGAASIPVVIDPSINLPLYFDQLNARADSAAILDEAGVLISFKVSSIHTSFDAGFSLREVAGLAVANGLNHESAIRALTINAARTWQISDHYGTLEAGMDADVVVWDGDPFEPASSPVHVFVAGIEAPISTRRTKLRDRYHPGRPHSADSDRSGSVGEE